MAPIESLYYNLPHQAEFQLGCADLPKDSGAVVLTRHSIRPPMHAGHFGTPLELNGEGIRIARKFGRFWGNRIHRVSTSSSLRCVQTGNEIIHGAVLKLPVLHNPGLGEPGAFISDSGQAVAAFKDLDPIGIVSRLLGGEKIQGHRTVEEGSVLLLKSFLNKMPEKGSIQVEVTHDTILAALLYFLQGLDSIGEEAWPRMMEGALFWRKAGRVYWRWRRETRSREMMEG